MRVNPRWHVTAVDSQTIARLRREFSEELASHGKTAAQIEDGTIILGELLANACEHGALPVQVELHPKGVRWRLIVSDAGKGFTPRRQTAAALSTRGRGLRIIERLGGTISIPREGVSAIDVLLPFGD